MRKKSDTRNCTCVKLGRTNERTNEGVSHSSYQSTTTSALSISPVAFFPFLPREERRVWHFQQSLFSTPCIL